MKLTDIRRDPSGIVWKLIFESASSPAIAETVVYRYNDRVVVCFSCQSGCPVGCVFCGTGNHFIRNLTVSEMQLQIEKGLNLAGRAKQMQIMAMSMGEPALNHQAVLEVAEDYLSQGYDFFFSTIGLRDNPFIDQVCLLGQRYWRCGLQFSLHSLNDQERLSLFRNKRLPYMTIEEMIAAADKFKARSRSSAYFNWICTPANATQENAEEMQILRRHHLTCSVMCNTSCPEKGDIQLAEKFASLVRDCTNEVTVSTFDPAGQDTIGGGCGQLWYVQEKLKELRGKGNKNEAL